MLRNRRTGHVLCCEKGKYLFIQETCSGIFPKVLHDSSVRQSNFSISCDLYSCGYCRVFLDNNTKVRGSFSVVLYIDGPARHLLFVKKESTEIDCFDPNHGFIQMYAFHRRALWVRVPFAGVKVGGGGGGVSVNQYFLIHSVP